MNFRERAVELSQSYKAEWQPILKVRDDFRLPVVLKHIQRVALYSQSQGGHFILGALLGFLVTLLDTGGYARAKLCRSFLFLFQLFPGSHAVSIAHF